MVDQKAVEKACIEQIEIVDGFPPDLEQLGGKLGVSVKRDPLTKQDNFYYKRKIIVTVGKDDEIVKHPVSPPVGNPAMASNVIEPEPLVKPTEEPVEPAVIVKNLEASNEVVLNALETMDKKAAKDFPEAEEDLNPHAMEEVFFVWRSGNRPPSFIHKSEESAVEEASRLAIKEIGYTFYVLKSTRAFVASAKVLEMDVIKGGR